MLNKKLLSCKFDFKKNNVTQNDVLIPFGGLQYK